MAKGFCIAGYIFTIIFYILITFSSSVYAQNVSGYISNWFEPNLGNELKIRCFNGSLVEFVADCSSPSTCQSLRLLENDMLECVPTIIEERLDVQSKAP
jgi:hypothetical protein